MKNIFVFVSLIFTIRATTLFSKFVTAPREIVVNRFGNGGEAEEASARALWETNRLADPATGRIPAGIRAKELEFAAGLPKLTSGNASYRMSSSFVYRGPVNVGGRTRALAVDITNDDVILAGSVNGGMYRSADGGQTWTRVSSLASNPAITWVAQDTRPGHTDTWYYSTGEGIGASGSGGGAYYLGNGLWKSTDGGLNWSSLTATSTNTPAVFDNVWDITYKVVTDPSDAVNDVVYAATYGTIYRSVNGGSTWTKVLGSTTSYSYYVDVDVTTTGIAYATLSSDGAQKGIFRRDTLGVWANINPPGWDTGTYNRVVIGINPSNESEIYFLGETPNMGKTTTNYKGDIEWSSLWKYTYLSGNGTGSGGQWDDLSVNLPYTGQQLGNFNSQGGYDLIIRVHPANPSVVFVGGTNLFRSDDGFTTSTMISHIGGYDSLATIPFYTNYQVHHSNQHNIVFLSSDPNVMIQANDGGLYKTTDNRAYPVVWEELNNGYNTAQMYSVAIDHGSSNDIIIGGMQDNGTWFTNTTNAGIGWTHPGYGDGGFCAIDNGHANYYMTRQEGKLSKNILDANGNVLSFGRIDPIDSVDYLFINPFVLDPLNNNVMYWAAGNHIWRNDSLTYLPTTGSWDSISTGWFRMPDSVNHANAYVTALGISTVPANRLYVGTNKRFLYRVDDANTSSPVTTEITSVAMNISGYINCIAVDPNNVDNILVVFSNYVVYSLFNSTDGGATFTKCGGNLEVNSAGAGNGPSVRWASIVPTVNGNVYLVATSTGLYGTNFLNGLTTVWTELSPNEIGNLVVDQLDTRASDGFVVAGTHGAGVFSATIDDTLATGVSTISVSREVRIYPNPASEKVTVDFLKSKNTLAKIKIFDVEGRLITQKDYNNGTSGLQSFTLNVASFENGSYFIAIIDGKNVDVRKIIINH